MEKEANLFFGFALIFLVVVGAIGISTAGFFDNKVDLENLKDNENIDSNIINEFEAGKETVRVIISVNDSEGEGNWLFNIFSKKKISVGEVKSQIDKKNRRYDLSENSFSAELTKEDIFDLVRNNGELEIGYVPKIKPNLEESVPQINSTLSRNLEFKGKNLKGASSTVCILDTGIDYTHLDLGNCTTEDFLGGSCKKVISGWDYGNQDNNPLDVDGHGTHVSGILSANGSLKGVAPDSKIISIKVFGDDGSGNLDNLKKGIEWCVDNSSKFNISVITMSLGVTYSGGDEIPYDDYCDSDYDGVGSGEIDLLTPINNAVSKNISVTVATGNYLGAGSITSPACIENATPVGSIRKDDETFDFNRNWMADLIAPGLSINSTYLDGGYNELSGTSMATPHVAGAIAILNQFLDLNNQTMTPRELEAILNNTGKRIYDGASGKNYSRIDVYNSILSLDNQKPVVNLVSPEDDFGSDIVNQSFSCNFSDNLELKNASFFLWNSSQNNSLVNNTDFSLSGNTDNITINLTNLPEDVYNWSCSACDSSGNCSTSENRSFTLNLDSPEINFESSSDSSRNYSKDWIFVNASASDYSLDTLKINLFLLNESSGNYFLSNFSLNNSFSGDNFTLETNFTNLSEGKYLLNFSANDSIGNTNSSIRNIWLDFSGPSINYSISPRAVVPGNNVTLNFSAVDSMLTVNSSFFNLSYPSGNSINIFENLSFETNESGRYNISFFANDSLGNSEIKESYFIAENLSQFNSSVNYSSNEISLNVYFRASDDLINSSVSSNDTVILSVPKYIYDLEYVIENDVFVKFQEINISEQNDREVRIQNASLEDYVKTIGINTSFNFSNSTLTLYYNESLFGNENYSGVYKCDDWNFSSSSCNTSVNASGWVNYSANVSQNTLENYFSVSTNSYSAFALKQESYCGDGTCQGDIGEDCSSCSVDCGVCDARTGDTGGSGGSGGGGGGSISNEYEPSLEQLEKGYFESLGEKDKILFQIKNKNSNNNYSENHSLEVLEVQEKNVSLQFNSSTINLVLSIGDEEKINFNQDNYYDLLVVLNSIKYSKANVTLKSISEKIEIQNKTGNKSSGKGNETKPREEKFENFFSKFTPDMVWQIAIAFAGIFLIIIYMVFHNKIKILLKFIFEKIFKFVKSLFNTVFGILRRNKK